MLTFAPTRKMTAGAHGAKGLRLRNLGSVLIFFELLWEGYVTYCVILKLFILLFFTRFWSGLFYPAKALTLSACRTPV